MSKFVFNDKNYSGEPNPINDSIISTNTTWSSDKINNKMDKSNPTGAGSLSLNRKANTTVGTNSVAVGVEITASGNYSHAEGAGTVASGNQAHAEGATTTASGNCAHAEGANATASGEASHAEGFNTIASSNYSHAEGYGSHAEAANSHAEGETTVASGRSSHAEGAGTVASGNQAHAEGGGTTASAPQAHAEGGGTTASGADSHAEGSYTIAKGGSQHAGGKYNIEDNNNTYAEIIGNGTADNARSNARTLDWSGNESLAGTIDASGFGTRLGALIPDIPTPTTSDIDKVIKVESDGQGGAQYTLGVGGSAETEIPGTLAAGASTVTLQNAAITTSSKIDYYAEVFGVHPINAAVTTGQIVLTYRPRATATGIKVVVS